MKKLITVLLAFLLMMSQGIFACGEAAMSYVGVWISSMVVDESACNVAEIGEQMTVKLQGDGTCLLDLEDMRSVGTWVATDTGVEIVEESGEKLSLLYVDGALQLSTSTATRVLVRSDAQAETRTGLMRADFDGTWELSHIETVEGELITPESDDFQSIVVLNDGSCLLTTESPEGKRYGTYWCRSEEVKGIGTVLNAMYGVTGAGDEIAFTLGKNDMLTMYLLDEGRPVMSCYFFKK